MKLSELKNLETIERPEGNGRTIEDGTYDGVIASIELVERESKYSKDGTRVVLNTKIEVEDAEGDTVDLFYAVNYSWSKKGNMLKFLEKLDALPNPGQSTRLSDLVGMTVRVSVENVTKDGETYSNIISIRKLEELRNRVTSPQQAPPRRPLPKPAQKRFSSRNEVAELFEEEDREEKAEQDLELD